MPLFNLLVSGTLPSHHNHWCFIVIVRSGRSSIRDTWANNVIWHQGLFLLKMLLFAIFVGYLNASTLFPLPGNLLSPDSLDEAFNGVTAVVCSPQLI